MLILLPPSESKRDRARGAAMDHTRLSFPHEGRDDTLTDEPVTRAKVVPALLG